MEDVQRAERDFPALRQWVEKLLALADKMMNNVRYSEDDHFAFMALCFLCKQIEHTKSILALIPSRDVILIARSMMEGLAQLLWAAREPDVLPLRWRAFAWVHDWRVMQAKIKAGEPVDPELSVAIESALQKYGDQFLTSKAQKAQKKGASLPPDPYHKDWRTGYKPQDIFASVGGEDLYNKLYKSFSDWQHWSAAGLGKAITRQGDRIIYSATSSTDAATALAVAFQCLLQTVKLVVDHLGIELTSETSELRDGYIADMGRNHASR
mgnify:CR=1 FL=1